MTFNKSPLKWAGSKARLLPTLLPILEKHREEILIEPFMGSCTVALNFKTDHYILSDLNGDLVNFFTSLTTNDVDYLITLAEGYFKAGREIYNTVREQFNNEPVYSVKRAAMFLYLNKFGFNGLCRYNKDGKFNVPVGKSASEPVIQYDVLKNVAKHLRLASFNQRTFQQSFSMAEKMKDRALIVCDPPYVPLTTDFNYTADGFGMKEQEELRRLANESKHTVIIHNHLTPYTTSLYSDADEVYTVDVNRTISCKGGERKKVKEIIVVYKGK